MAGLFQAACRIEFYVRFLSNLLQNLSPVSAISISVVGIVVAIVAAISVSMAIVSMSVPVSMAIEPAVVVPWISFRFGVSLSLGCWFSTPLLTSVVSIAAVIWVSTISVSKVSIAVSAAIESAIEVVGIGIGIGISRGLCVGRPLSNEVMSDDSIGSCAGGQLDSSGRLLGGQSGGAVHSRNLVDGSGQVTVAASLGLVAADSDGSGSESRDHSDTRDGVDEGGVEVREARVEKGLRAGGNCQQHTGKQPHCCSSPC